MDTAITAYIKASYCNELDAASYNNGRGDGNAMRPAVLTAAYLYQASASELSCLLGNYDADVEDGETISMTRLYGWNKHRAHYEALILRLANGGK